MHSLDDIASASGIKIPFVRKVLRELESIFRPHKTHSAHNNQIMLDDSGLVLMKRVGSLKNQGHTLPSIREILTSEGVGKADSQTRSNQTDKPSKISERTKADTRDMLDHEREARHAAELQLVETRGRLELLQSQVRLLEGSDQRRERIDRERQVILADLAEIERQWFVGAKRRKLIARLQQLQPDILDSESDT